MIFPEFEYREDVEAIKAYAQKVKNELDTVCKLTFFYLL